MNNLSRTTHELEFQKWLQFVYENECRRLTERRGELLPQGPREQTAPKPEGAEKLERLEVGENRKESAALCLAKGASTFNA